MYRINCYDVAISILHNDITSGKAEAFGKFILKDINIKVNDTNTMLEPINDSSSDVY